MRHLSLLLLILPAFLPSEVLGSPRRPNIILIVSDDQRNDSLGIAGHPALKTPEIDRLAEEGTRFVNAFVTTPICAASRASIFTGLRERTHGFTFNKPPVSSAHCSIAYPAALKEAGYTTAFFGKFGISTESAPENGWFDSMVKISRNPYFHTLPDGSKKHETELVADHAIGFLESAARDKPFCLSLSFNAPHAEDSDLDNHFPYPPSSNGLYEETEMPPPRLNDPAIFEAMPELLKASLNRKRFYWRWDTPEKYDRNLRNYFRMISGIDYEIGRIRSALERLDLSENTIILFTSDNGYYMGDRGFAGKWSHFEEALRVPFVLFDPRLERSRRGATRDEMVLNIDIAPTLLDLAGIPAPAPYEGKSVTPLIGDHPEDSQWRDRFHCEHLMEHALIPKWRGIRTQRYVYADYFEQNPNYLFLHDLKEDPDQLRNLANDPDYQEILQELKRSVETN